MIDKSTANNVIVGVLVTVGFFVLLFVLFNVGGGAGLFSSQRVLYGKFLHVKGLHAGSEVSLAGLRIGVVKDIRILPESPKELIVEMRIDRKMMPQVRQDSVASVKTQGVLGDRYIEISIGSPESPPVEAGSTLPTDEPEDLFTKGGSLVEEVKRYFDKGGNMDKLMKNLTDLSGNLADLTGDVKKSRGLLHEMIYGTSGQKVADASSQLAGILRKVNEGDGTLGALINDPTVYEDLKALMGGAKRSTILKYFMRSFIESGSEKSDAKR